MSEPMFCPECRSEYVATATTCSDCDVALVHESSLSDGRPEELPPVSELVCIRASAVGWARALSERLAEAGISHRIEATSDDEDEGSVRRPGANLPYGVYVRPEDQERAAAVDADFMQQQIPDMPMEPTQDVDAEGCPACGAAAPADASECPDCGLALL